MYSEDNLMTTTPAHKPLDANLRVIHVARPAQIGGTITSTLRQAQAEFDLGRDVQVWSLIQRQKNEFVEMAKRYTVRAKLVSEVGSVVRMMALRLSLRPCVVHLHSGRSTLSSKVQLMRRLMGRRVAFVVSLHGPSKWEPHEQETWRQAHIALHPMVAAIAVPSAAEREVQIADGIPPEKVFVVPDIIREHSGQRGQLRRELGLEENTPLVLFCGRMVHEKGPKRVIEAFRLVLASRPNSVLVIAGDGQQLEECRQVAADLGQKVRFMGHVANVGQLYAESDVFVAPSTGESFGISGMEAALAGIPMVLSRIRPWTDVFQENQECLFVDCEDVGSIARMVLQHLDNPARAREMAALAKRTVQDGFSPSAAMAALSQTYRFALQSA